MNTQNASLPKFSHEDRIRMHFQRKQIRADAKAYTKHNFLRLVPYALLYMLPGLLGSTIGLLQFNSIYLNIIRFILIILLYPITRIGVANAILRLWNEQRLQGSDLLIAVRSPIRLGKAVSICIAESALSWLISFFPSAGTLIPTIAAQLFAAFFSFVPFLFSRNPDASAIDLVKESFRKMYRFFWQWFGVVLRACKWILISSPFLLMLSMLAISLITGQTMIAEYLNLGMLITFVPIALFLIPYYLLATTGFVNDQVLSEGQPKSESNTTSPA